MKNSKIRIANLIMITENYLPELILMPSVQLHLINGMESFVLKLQKQGEISMLKSHLALTSARAGQSLMLYNSMVSSGRQVVGSDRKEIFVSPVNWPVMAGSVKSIR